MSDRRSRYAKTAIVELRGPGGETLELIDVRTIPAPGRTTRVIEIEVPADGRLDRLAHRYYRDPEQFWRICDAAEVLDPFDLVVPGERLKIPVER